MRIRKDHANVNIWLNSCRIHHAMNLFMSWKQCVSATDLLSFISLSYMIHSQSCCISWSLLCMLLILNFENKSKSHHVILTILMHSRPTFYSEQLYKYRPRKRQPWQQQSLTLLFSFYVCATCMTINDKCSHVIIRALCPGSGNQIFSFFMNPQQFLSHRPRTYAQI